jgi:nucleoside-diphosphate-sugar epimerase
VLVTGATGFAGGHLAVALTRRGYHVRALVRPTANVERLRQHGVELVEGDLVRDDDIDRAVRGTRLVFHVAALYRSAKHRDDYYYDVNVEGTRRVLYYAERHGVERVVHCSTVGVHGGLKEIPGDEGAPLRPGDIYQLTKLEGERVAQEKIRAGMPVAVVRPGAIYGPGDMRFLKLFSMIQRRRFLMFGRGEVYYHFVYVDDLVDGFLLCAEKPEAVGNTYIIAGDEYVTLNRLVALVAKLVGSRPPKRGLPLWPLLVSAGVCEALCRPLGIEPPLHRRRADFFVKNRAFSIERARRDLGYRPKVPLEDGLGRTAQWYMEHGFLRRA